MSYDPIRKAYLKAMSTDKYDSVSRKGSPPEHKEKHYACTNFEEYFAETVEAYFWENDFFPYVRSELEEFDPEGAEMVR